MLGGHRRLDGRLRHADTNQPTASDEADVRFMQHMAGHLLQTTSILDLTQDRITRPKLARLADTINQQGQAHLAQLQAWLATRGLAPYDPQQQPSNGKETDLQRLSRVSKGHIRPGVHEGDDDPTPRWQQAGRRRTPRRHPARGPPARPAAAGHSRPRSPR
jgi:Domain of unknown function (DUF305)